MNSTYGRRIMLVVASGFFALSLVSWPAANGLAEESKGKSPAYINGLLAAKQFTDRALGLVKDDASPARGSTAASTQDGKSAVSKTNLSGEETLDGKAVGYKGSEVKRTVLMPLGGNPDDTRALLGMAEVDRKDMTRFSATSIAEYRAELLLGLKVSESDSILLGRGVQFDRPTDIPAKVQDDGWRFRFIKRF